MKPLSYILAVLLLTLTACSDAIDVLFGGGIEEGDAVAFTTLVPDVKHDTRSAKEEWQREVRAYKAVNRAYTFDIEMWKQGDKTATAQSQYCPIVDGGGQYHSDGTLQPLATSSGTATPLYWQDNVHRWGFRATAGTTTLAADQTDQAKWLAQDRLVGYSYLPIWTGDDDDGIPADNFNAINYRTSKQWYADNKTAKDLSGLMVESTDDYKKVPLFLQHQRSWLTLILKAGEGVEREALAYGTSATNIATTLYSYKDGAAAPMDINAWSSEEFIDYEADQNGPAVTGVSTTRYDAIVEPHNFIANATTQEQDLIARIHLSDQKFTFAAANDFRYGDFLTGNAAATEAMQAYNLLPGKHLTIVATLSRGSRLILITAWIEDWTDTVTQTICDDYGQNGNPYLINNKQELIDFLKDPVKNKAGNVGLIVPNVFPALNDSDGVWVGSAYTLSATLNLANAKMQIGKQFVNEISRTGSIINGEFFVDDSFADRTTLATTNKGSIERVRITTSSDLSPAQASVAGLVDTNYGNIYQCSSTLRVKGSGAGYVGGIAARNLKEAGVDVQPTIENCTVVARVDGDETVTAGGGIVGQAEGHVSNNTFEYGITLLQKSQFHNIVGAVGTNHLETHTNNSWPTMEEYTVDGTTIHNASSVRYDAVIDCEDELKELLKSTYNTSGKKYRIASSFAVDRDTWIWGMDPLNEEYFAIASAHDDYNHGLVRFILNGNDKTILLTGSRYATMLFGAVIGEIYDLNLTLKRPLVAERILSQNAAKDDSNTDAIAALAYSVTVSGTARGSIRNVHLRQQNDTYIEASTPGGIVVWASHGGELTNCSSDVPVRMHLTTDGVDARHYAGGIVACAEKATIRQCHYYADHGVGWATDDAGNIDKAQKNNCRYGGIVGGTTEIANSNDTPELVLAECYSWWEPTKFSADVPAANRPIMGSLIGSTVYHDPAVATRLYNAMAKDNAGNWWTGLTGAGMLKSDVTEEQAIGRKNSIQPSKPEGL